MVEDPRRIMDALACLASAVVGSAVAATTAAPAANTSLRDGLLRLADFWLVMISILSGNSTAGALRKAPIRLHPAGANVLEVCSRSRQTQARLAGRTIATRPRHRKSQKMAARTKAQQPLPSRSPA